MNTPNVSTAGTNPLINTNKAGYFYSFSILNILKQTSSNLVSHAFQEAYISLGLGNRVVRLLMEFFLELFIYSLQTV